ncbi:MAG: Inner rane component of cytoplasmic domain [Thermoplasmata archaeon]|jgi:DNA-binding transcriptional ArsR family regulator|nr:Inner rane component of cytoplasmic domain [Thermoplasmata archaeon]
MDQDEPLGAPDSTAAFADALRALATPARIRLLRELRTPRTVTQITLRGPETKAGGRILARQTVKQHLDRLVEMGIVVARDADRGRGTTLEYVVNHRALFSLSEEVRALARLRPAEPVAGLTQVFAPAPSPAHAPGPRLVLVKGLDEGQVFGLKPPATGEAAWLIGRRRGLAVSLDFDASVSAENARIRFDGVGYRIEDLPHSRNGTQLNFETIAKGKQHPLEKGDIIGVGRSALVFQA